MILTDNANLPCRTPCILPRLPCRLVSLHYRSPNDAALSVELFVQLFFQVPHLLVELTCVIGIPMPLVFVSWNPGMTLRHFFLGEFDGHFLLLSLAQNRERYV